MNYIGANISQKTKGILPEGIRWWNRMLRNVVFRIKGILYNRAYGNHMETIIDQDKNNPDRILICGAIKEGVKIRWKNLSEMEGARVLKRKIALTPEQHARLLTEAYKIENRPYYFANFPAWMIRIASRLSINLFQRELPDGTYKSYNCYMVATCLGNASVPGTFPDYEPTISIHVIEQNVLFDWAA